MSDLPRDPILDDGEGENPDLDQPEDLEPEVEEAEEGDEPEAAAGDDEDGEAEPEPRRRQRGRAFGEQLRERDRRIDDLTRQVQTLATQPRPPAIDPQAQARADQEFWASLDLMTPAEAHRAVYNRATREVSQAFYQQQTQTQEAIDKQAYDAQARTSRVHQQYRSRVEELVANERARGNIVTRDVALRHLIGDDAITRANKVAPAQRRQGAARVAAQTVRPGNGRGDVARGGNRQRNQDSDDEALLRGTRVADI